MDAWHDDGPAAVFADRREPMEAIFDRFIDDASAAMARLQGLAKRPLADAIA